MMLMQGNAVFMSSLELLDLVNQARLNGGETAVRHTDFVTRCRDELDGEHYENFVVQNLNKTTTEAIRMTSDQCKLVAMRESKMVRRAVLTHLSELEAKQAPMLPDFSNPAAAARAWAEQYEMRDAATKALAIAAPKAEFVDRYVDAKGLYGFRQVAKMLRAKENEFSQWLQDEGIMYRLAGKLTPCAAHLTTGRFEVKAGANEAGRAFTQAKFTAKGFEWVAGKWAARQLEAGV